MKTSHRTARALRTEPSNTPSRSAYTRTATFDLATQIPFDQPDRVRPLCADEHPELFFPQAPRDLTAAQDVCLECPLIADCLAVGLARREYGVWGGVLLEAGSPTDRIRPERGPIRRATPVPTPGG